MEFAEMPEWRCVAHGEVSLPDLFSRLLLSPRQTFDPEIPMIYASYPAETAKSCCSIFVFLQEVSFSQSTNSNNSLLSYQHGLKDVSSFLYLFTVLY